MIERDPRYWTKPEQFYPERFIDSSVDFKGAHFEFIPLGAGRRMCPGLAFATAGIELILATLLFHFDWKLPQWDNPMKIFGIALKRKGDIYLIPVPLFSSSPILA